MEDPVTALTHYQFTIDASIAEWLEQKRLTRSGSAKTITAYRETMQQFRDFLTGGGLDLLSNPIDVARVAPLWASTRRPSPLKKDGTPNQRHTGEVSPATYNQRLAVVSSWYTFVQQTYKLDIPNPIKDVPKRKVQAYAAAVPIEPDVVETGLGNIDRNQLQGLRDYAILAVALYTGRRASELVGLRGEDITLQGKGKGARVLLRFHCKGGKIEYNRLNEVTSAVLLEYLSAQFGKQLLAIAPDAPIWVSYSRQNRGKGISVQTLSLICDTYLGTSKNHALRHTFAVAAIRSDIAITDLADLLGHTSIIVTQRYTKELNKTTENPHGDKITTRFGIRRKAK
ncbi:MAG TPA: tyrosine-type recombinase/integrase [Ktedonobacteraceae bacterium]